MLSDLFILENFYDHPSCPLFFEDVARRYGLMAIREALRQGQIHARPVLVGPDAGRVLLSLTDKGRSHMV